MLPGFIEASGTCGVKSIMGFTELASRKGKHPAMDFDGVLSIYIEKKAAMKRGGQD